MQAERFINITVVNDKVTGSITEVTSDGRVGISGKIYKLSQYYQQYAMKNKPDSILSLGDTGTFYLNSNGEIAAVDKGC